MTLRRLVPSALTAVLALAACGAYAGAAGGVSPTTAAPSGCIVGRTTHFDVALLIDQSSSLRDGGALPRLREGLAAAAKRFRFADDDGRVDVSLGVIEFGEGARIVQPLSAFDEARLSNLAVELSDLTGLTNFTDYVAALESALDMFSAAEQRDTCRVLIWFTDGKFDVEQFNRNQPREEAAYLRSRVCGEGNEVTLAERAWSLGIATYALLVGEPPRGEVADASIHAMQAVSGDDDIDTSGWPSAAVLSQIDPQCGRFVDKEKFPRNRIGQVVVDSTELAVQLDRLILESIGARSVGKCPFDLQGSRDLGGLPAGLFVERIEVTAVGQDEVSVSIDPKDGSPVLERSLIDDRLSIGGDGDRPTLDRLRAGWSLTANGTSRSVCVQLFPRSTLPRLTLEPAPSEVTGGGQFALRPVWSTLSPSLDGPDSWRGSIDSWRILAESTGEFASLEDGSAGPVDPDSSLSLTAVSSNRSFAPLSTVLVEIVPASGSDRDAVTVEAIVSPSVEFRPQADAPSISCDGDLSVRASGDVPDVDEALRSSGSCTVVAPAVGTAVVTLGYDSLPEVDGVTWQFVNEDGVEVEDGFGLSPGDAPVTVFLQASEPLSDQDWLIVGEAQIDVTWILEGGSDGNRVGGETFTVEIDLSNRPEPIYAGLISVVITLLASLLSLSLLWLLNQKLVRLQSADQFYFRDAAIRISRDESAGQVWSPPDALAVAQVNPVRSERAGDDLTAGTLRIERVAPPFWAPFREPVARVTSHAIARVTPGAAGSNSCPLGFASLTAVVVGDSASLESSAVDARVVHLYRRHVAQPDFALASRDVTRMAADIRRHLPSQADPSTVGPPTSPPSTVGPPTSPSTDPPPGQANPATRPPLPPTR